MIICSKCGKQNPDGVKFCPACGTPLQNTANLPQKQSASPSTVNSSKKLPGTTVLIQIILVFVICALIPLLLGTILGTPARLLKGILPQWTCTGTVEGSTAMYFWAKHHQIYGTTRRPSWLSPSHWYVRFYIFYACLPGEEPACTYSACWRCCWQSALL